MTNWVKRNEELVYVPFDELTDEECDHVVWRTEREIAWELYTFITKQDEAYEEEE